MKPSINLFSEKKGEIKNFLESFYSTKLELKNDLVYKKHFDSPIDMIDFMSCFIDNNDKFKINLYSYI